MGLETLSCLYSEGRARHFVLLSWFYLGLFFPLGELEEQELGPQLMGLYQLWAKSVLLARHSCLSSMAATVQTASVCLGLRGTRPFALALS